MICRKRLLEERFLHLVMRMGLAAALLVTLARSAGAQADSSRRGAPSERLALTAPRLPVASIALFSGGAQATLSWTAVPNIKSYTLQRDDAADFKTPLEEVSRSSTTLRHTFKGLQAGRTFWYRVRGDSVDGSISGWSNTVSSTQDATAPAGWIGVGDKGSFPPAYTARLVLDVTDPGTKPAGIYQMRFSTDQRNWSPWQPYAARATYFAKRSGTLAITAQVRDRVGNTQNFTTTATVAAIKALFVDAANTSGPWKGTLQNPYRKIQDAVTAAQNKTVVVVAPGIYALGVGFLGKSIVLRSVDPEAPEIVKATTIRGDVVFNGDEDATCQLAGFTIAEGSAETGGGINGQGTHAAILNNRILNNQALLSDTTIIPPKDYNPAVGGVFNVYIYKVGLGGGIAGCDGLIQNNIIAGNVTGNLSPPAIRAGKSGQESPIINYGPPTPHDTYVNHYTIRYAGAALYNCNGTIQNNTIWGNLSSSMADGSDGVIQNCNGIMRNNIVWNNGAHHILQSSGVPAYSDIQDWTGGGTGNVSVEPLLVNPAQGDFHLQAGSPCIDAGVVFTGQLRDMEGTPRGLGMVNNLRGDGWKYDLGALEYFPNPAVWVLEPRGGETLKAGAAFRMQFTMNPLRAGAWARVDLRNATGKVLQNWVVNVPASGEYLFIKPLPDVAGTGFRLRVTSVSNGALWGQSPPFTIVK